jgi:hypothetical protein
VTLGLVGAVIADYSSYDSTLNTTALGGALGAAVGAALGAAFSVLERTERQREPTS